MRVAIIGTGAYGIALSLMFHKHPENTIKMWTKFEEEKNSILANRENEKVLKGVKIPKDIEISTDLHYVVSDAEIVVIAVPAAFVDDVSKELKSYNKNRYFVLASKGIERDTCLFVADIFTKYVKTKKYCVISGPSFAVDIASYCPIGMSIASGNKKTIKVVKKALENDTLKLRPTEDVVGVEICGSIKNVMAIAAGILDGMGYPESTQAMFLTESIHDIKALIEKLGGDKNTILSFAGFGDLLLTATSKKSRNFTFGYMIGSRVSKQELDDYTNNTTIEGLYTIQSIYKLLKHKKVKIPVIDLIHRIISGKASINELPKFLIEKK